MLQVLLNGLVAGLSLALLAVGFALVHGTTRVLFLCIGGVYALAPFVAVGARGLGVPMPLALAGAVACAAAVALLQEEGIHWPLSKRQVPDERHLLASLGLYLVVVQCVVLLWGPSNRFLVPDVRVMTFGGLRLSVGQAMSAVASLVFLIGVLTWLARSGVGLRLRAMAANPDLLSSLGQDVRLLRRVAFLAAGILAAIAGLCVGADLGFDPDVGLTATIGAIAAAIVGGYRPVSVAVAAVALGVVQALSGRVLSGDWQEAITFVVLAVALLVAPKGGPSSWGALERPEAQ